MIVIAKPDIVRLRFLALASVISIVRSPHGHIYQEYRWCGAAFSVHCCDEKVVCLD